MTMNQSFHKKDKRNLFNQQSMVSSFTPYSISIEFVGLTKLSKAWALFI